MLFIPIHKLFLLCKCKFISIQVSDLNEDVDLLKEDVVILLDGQNLQDQRIYNLELQSDEIDSEVQGMKCSS